MSNYIIFWKDAPGQQVSTTVDALNNPVQYDDRYLQDNNVPVAETPDDVIAALQASNGVKYAITRENARNVLGWDV